MHLKASLLICVRGLNDRKKPIDDRNIKIKKKNKKKQKKKQNQIVSKAKQDTIAVCPQQKIENKYVLRTHLLGCSTAV